MRSWSSPVGLLLTLVIVALPLFGDLGEPDVGSDEAIYSYAVERMLETRDWLTPRSIPSDAAFLEKPPLKFWMVAAGMQSGVLPRNELGMRLIDAVFGLVGCAYVYLMGRRLGGIACGAVAALTLISIEPLVFDHGLRSNNMEGAVFLCYCGGLYHAVRWIDGPVSHGWRPALAVCAYFTLGFLTKFVAALFLPVIVVAAAVWRPQGAKDLRERWRDWVWPLAAAGAVIVPWFVYQSMVAGAYFWEVILGTHVYERFAGVLDPDHLAPWHFYVTQSWQQVARLGVALLWVAGMIRLLMAAWHGAPWTARVVLLWGALPVIAISFGTSKLLHYAYPFFPPLALAVGYAASWLLEQARSGQRPSRDPFLRALRGVLLATAVLAAIVWLATAREGRLLLEADGIVLFRNSSVWRPAVLAAALLALSMYGDTRRRMVAGVALVVLLPLATYAERLDRLARVQHPLRATRDCMRAMSDRGRDAPGGVLSASGNILHHAYYYYLWREGPFVIAPSFDAAAVLARLSGSGPHTPVLLARHDYEAIEAALPPDIGAARYDDGIAVLFPGPIASCERAVVEAGGQPIWSSTLAGPSR